MGWLLLTYSKEGDTILETHLGSGSIAIACHNLGFDLTGYEIDKEYFEAATKRLQQHKQQTRLLLMRWFKPLKKDKPNKKQKAASFKQRERFIEEDRKPNIKRNGVLITKKDNNEL